MFYSESSGLRHLRACQSSRARDGVNVAPTRQAQTTTPPGSAPPTSAPPISTPPQTLTQLLEERGTFPVDQAAVDALRALYVKHEPKREEDGEALLLATGAEKPSFAAAARELLSTSRVRQTLPERCSCGEELKKIQGPKHLLSCETGRARDGLQEDLFGLLAGKPCPKAGCKATLSKKLLQCVDQHIRKEDEKSSICGFKLATGGAPCQFPQPSSPEGTLEWAALRVHRERVHGFPCPARAHLMERYGVEEPVLVGAEDVMLGAEERLAEGMDSMDNDEFCGICLRDPAHRRSAATATRRRAGLGSKPCCTTCTTSGRPPRRVCTAGRRSILSTGSTTCGFTATSLLVGE